jgi:hypothetical protein
LNEQKKDGVKSAINSMDDTGIRIAGIEALNKSLGPAAAL